MEPTIGKISFLDLAYGRTVKWIVTEAGAGVSTVTRQQEGSGFEPYSRLDFSLWSLHVRSVPFFVGSLWVLWLPSTIQKHTRLRLRQLATTAI